MKEQITKLVEEVQEEVAKICRVLMGLEDDIDKVMLPEGNNKANARISTALLTQCVKFKALSKKVYAVRNQVIEHGKGKKEIRKASDGPKPTPPKPKPKKAAAPPPPPPK
jgi:hypothetical protein